MNIVKYKKLINAFKEKGYLFKKFENFNTKLNGQVILRHDIDFSMELAFQIAILEKKLGINSTFFFLLTSNSYNLLSKKNIIFVKVIKDMGHSIGLHFDPTVYDEEKKGFDLERETFENYFGKFSSISFHRPSKETLGHNLWLPKRISSTYQKKFFKDITYISDSRGIFKFGSPIDNKAFKLCKNIQLLIHPIWWMTNQRQPVEKIKKFLTMNRALMSKHISKNCTPWKKHNEQFKVFKKKI